ncbi:MAG: Gfo/Idh/MocA family oxidoreductase [Acidobacteriota bacterium]
MPEAATSRRSILGGPAAFAAAASYNRILGANDRPGIGVIGTGGRGTYLLREIKKTADVDVIAVCDVYDARRDKAAEIAGPRAQKFGDHRHVLADNNIDAVIVATPDHWHGPITVDACRAGKDVYVEKPMVHYPKDGQAIVRAARQFKRIIQVGTQGRGMTQNIAAKQQYVESGVMGKVGLVRTWYTSNRGYIATAPAGMEQKPAGLDWDRWLGPGPKIPWNPGVYFSPYKWLHYDGGMIMGIAVHVIDTAHFVLGLKRPKAASAGGGVYFYNDGRDTPDTVALVLDYPENVTLTFVAEALTAPGVRTSAGIELRGTGGKLYVERYTVKEALEYTPNGKFSKAPAARSDGSEPSAASMLKNWLECIRTRQKPIANEEEAYWSTMACFMCNHAFRTASRVTWDNKWNLPG